MSADKPEEFAATASDDNPAIMDSFEPPADFEHGPEFSGDPPRSLPGSVRRSRYVRARQATFWILLIIGAACWATARLPFVQMLSWYLLPLGYLNWIGSAFFALAAFYSLRNVVTLGHLDLVRRGEPLMGRIRQVGVRGEGTAEVPSGRFVAEVEFRHPSLGTMQLATMSAPEGFVMRDLPKMYAGVSPGDYVTLVYLPGRLEKTLQLYGWLGLNPELDLIRKNGHPLKPMSPITALTLVIAVTALGWGLLAFVYVIGRYTPLDGSVWKPYAIGIAVSATMFFIILIRRVERDGATAFTIFKRYASMGFVSLLFGFMVGWVCVGFLNCYFDRSSAHLEPVKIIQLWNQTHHFVVRTYELEYQRYPAGQIEKNMVTVETLSSFQPDSLGVIDIGSGWLGVRWIRDFHPVVWEKIDERNEKEPGYPGEVTFRMPNEPQPTRIVPLVVIAKNLPLSPPAVLLPELRKRITLFLTDNLGATVIVNKKE